MTIATQVGQRVASTSIRQRLSDLTMGLALRGAQDRAYRTTVRELSAMSTRDLTDIGIDRADIHTIAQQVAYGS